MKVSVKKRVDVVRRFYKDLDSLLSKSVLVGIPEAQNSREAEEDSGPMNNATLGYIHEKGSPAANIPARPFLVPGIEDAQEAIEKSLGAAVVATLNREPGKADAALEKAGLVAVSKVKAKINEGDFEPLSNSTLRARARRGREGAIAELERRKAGEAPGTADAKPLIDTGQLRNAITYVVRKKK